MKNDKKFNLINIFSWHIDNADGFNANVDDQRAKRIASDSVSGDNKKIKKQLHV